MVNSKAKDPRALPPIQQFSVDLTVSLRHVLIMIAIRLVIP